MFLVKSAPKSQNPHDQNPASGGKYGLDIVHDDAKAIVDIIFVHGITGNRETTWTYNANAAQSLFWPRDLLPRDLQDARIMTYGYDADVAHFYSMASQNRIGEHAGNFVNQVTVMRERTDSEDRPIILVTHSMGGLVAEDSLVYSKNSAEPHLRKFQRNLAGICFLGTPHCGSDVARWATIMASLVNVAKTANKELVGVLKPDSEVLGRVQRDFQTMLRRSPNQFHITCFYEELPVRGLGEVVEKHSAILPSFNAIGIRANHMDMTKFSSPTDPGYFSVSGELLRWAKGIRAASRTRTGERYFDPFAGLGSSYGNYNLQHEERPFDNWRAAPPTQVEEDSTSQNNYGRSQKDMQISLSHPQEMSLQASRPNQNLASYNASERPEDHPTSQSNDYNSHQASDHNPQQINDHNAQQSNNYNGQRPSQSNSQRPSEFSSQQSSDFHSQRPNEHPAQQPNSYILHQPNAYNYQQPNMLQPERPYTYSPQQPGGQNPQYHSKFPPQQAQPQMPPYTTSYPQQQPQPPMHQYASDYTQQQSQPQMPQYASQYPPQGQYQQFNYHSPPHAQPIQQHQEYRQPQAGWSQRSPPMQDVPQQGWEYPPQQQQYPGRPEYERSSSSQPSVTNYQYTASGGKTVSGNNMTVTGGNITF